MQTILERDIAFYQAMQEQHRDTLRRCEPQDEPRHAKLAKLAENVRKALDAYRTAGAEEA